MTIQSHLREADAVDKKLCVFRDLTAVPSSQLLFPASLFRAHRVLHLEQAAEHSCSVLPKFGPHCHVVRGQYAAVLRPACLAKYVKALAPVRIVPINRRSSSPVHSCEHALQSRGFLTRHETVAQSVAIRHPRCSARYNQQPVAYTNRAYVNPDPTLDGALENVRRVSPA